MDSSETRLQIRIPTRADLPRIIVLRDVDTQIRYFNKYCLVSRATSTVQSLPFPSAQANLVLLRSYFCCHSRLHTHIPHPANPPPPGLRISACSEGKPTFLNPCGNGFGFAGDRTFSGASKPPGQIHTIFVASSVQPQQLHRPRPVPDLALDGRFHYKKSQLSLVLSLCIHFL